MTYYRLFRIGEVTSGSHPVLARDVYLGENKKKFLFILRSLKTHTECNQPQMVKISSTPKRESQPNGTLCNKSQLFREPKQKSVNSTPMSL